MLAFVTIIPSNELLSETALSVKVDHGRDEAEYIIQKPIFSSVFLLLCSLVYRGHE